MKRKADQDIYQIKVTLTGIDPPIWRRLLVRSKMTLGKLHRVIQIAMGWDDCHLHCFSAKGQVYEDLSMNPESASRDEDKTKLKQVLQKEKDFMIYEYDFGDSWEHEILLEKILPSQPRKKLPVCTGGERACPPEDCGGIWGYQELLEAFEDPSDPEYEELIEWVGEDFDPEEFDPDLVNKQL